MKSTMEMIALGVAEQGIDILLIGGMALPAFGVSRQTMDIVSILRNTPSVGLESLKRMCERYDAEGVYEKIVGAL